MSYLDNTKFWADKKGHILTFEHIATGLSASFKAFVTSFSDNFESNWNSEDVYGRMDPIQTFQGTKRTIDVEWDVVASSAIEAMNNQNWCSKLFRMLYPVYESTGSSSTMQASPLLRLKFANLIQDVNTGGGLVGTSSGFSYTPDFDYGVFDLANGELYPKVIKLKCTFTVLHTHNLGFTAGNHHWNDGPGFPYEYNEPPPSIEERAAAADKAILDAEKAKEDAQKMSGALALLFGAVEGTAEKDRQASAARHAKRHASHARSLELITTTAMDAININSKADVARIPLSYSSANIPIPASQRTLGLDSIVDGARSQVPPTDPEVVKARRAAARQKWKKLQEAGRKRNCERFERQGMKCPD